VGRVALVRWQLQTFLEYGAVLALYEELAQRNKPDEIDTLAVRMLFHVRALGWVRLGWFVSWFGFWMS
jgi:hypothetical protein